MNADIWEAFHRSNPIQTGRIKVLYIAGAGRIGSTLVGNVLGHIPGFFFVSEIINIWRHFIINKGHCGCGATASDCEVWGPVLSKAFDDSGLGIAERMDYWRNHSTLNRYSFTLLFPSLRARFAARLKEYLNGMEKLYLATQSVTGCRVIVDSSKRPTYAILLNMISTIDLYIVHLVRDPRAVSYSWFRKKIQSDDGKRPSYMRTMSPASSATRWLMMNSLTELFWRRLSRRYMLVRYEDFVTRPQESIHNILGMIGEEPALLPFVGERTVKLGVNHAVWGNPNRRESGTIELRLDDEWKSGMRPVDKVIVSILTWPLLKKYGYSK